MITRETCCEHQSDFYIVCVWGGGVTTWEQTKTELFTLTEAFSDGSKPSVSPHKTRVSSYCNFYHIISNTLFSSILLQYV